MIILLLYKIKHKYKEVHYNLTVLQQYLNVTIILDNQVLSKIKHKYKVEVLIMTYINQ